MPQLALSALKPGYRRFALLEHGRQGKYLASIHDASCRDIRREQMKHAATRRNIVTDKGVARVVAYYLDPATRDLGYDERSVKVHGCCS